MSYEPDPPLPRPSAPALNISAARRAARVATAVCTRQRALMVASATRSRRVRPSTDPNLERLHAAMTELSKSSQVSRVRRAADSGHEQGDATKLQLLGQGSYGKVRLARLPHNSQTVVLKEDREEKRTSDSLVPLWVLREMLVAAAAPNARHLVCMHELLFAPQRVYCCLEVAACDLSGLLMAAGVGLARPVGLHIARQILMGLRSLHDVGIIHRDVKESNVLLTSRGCAKLCDFGLSSASALTDSVVCTVTHRPPEVFFTASEHKPSIDIWGWACIVYRLHTAEKLFPGGTALRILHLIVQLLGPPDAEKWPALHSAEFAIPPSIRTVLDVVGGTAPEPYAAIDALQTTDAAKAVLRRCLSWDPDRRPTAAALIADPAFDDGQVCGDDEVVEGTQCSVRLHTGKQLSLLGLYAHAVRAKRQPDEPRGAPAAARRRVG